MKLLAFLSTIILTLSYPYSLLAQNEWKFWNNLSQNDHKQIATENSVTYFILEKRFMDDFNHQAHHSYKPAALFKSNKYIDFDFNYLSERNEDKIELSYEPGSEIIPIAILNEINIILNFKTRFEYNNLEGNPGWTWREKIKIEKSITVGPFEITPFISKELIYDFKNDGINQSLLTTGVSNKIIKNFKVDFFYMQKNDRRDGNFPEVSVLLGTEINVKF